MNGSGPEGILRLAQSFMESRILLSGAELNLFTILGRTPLSAREAASRIGVDLRAITILLDALASMGLLIKRDQTYQCDSSISPYLAEDSPISILPMLLHVATLWTRWSALTDILQGHIPSKEAARFFRSAEELRAFIGAMHVAAAPLASRIVAEADPGSSKILLDVGGGSGTYTIAFLRAVPGMKATLFDQPEVIEMARERLTNEGLLDRVCLVAGDFYRDELPPGHDLALISAVIHQNSHDQNLDLFSKMFRSLNRGGRILVRDHVMEPDRIHPKDGAIFAVNMLLGTPGGGTYTYEEIEASLKQAGFARVRLLKKGEHMDALIEGFKP